ncbi:hypothetical protein MRB53_041909 [Persea americana]|nr:hypothetical protein MRB53_041909 [Persea americana]
MTWQEVVAKKKRIQQDDIDAHLQRFPPTAYSAICDIDNIDELCASLQARTVTAEEVILAYSSAAAEAHKKWCETENPLWGLTTHGLNPAWTPGGSSGGEGALLSLKGSIVGFGTDIGGSMRIPASMSGLYALRPSVGLQRSPLFSSTP